MVQAPQLRRYIVGIFFYLISHFLWFLWCLYDARLQLQHSYTAFKKWRTNKVTKNAFWLTISQCLPTESPLLSGLSRWGCIIRKSPLSPPYFHFTASAYGSLLQDVRLQHIIRMRYSGFGNKLDFSVLVDYLKLISSFQNRTFANGKTLNKT